MITIRKAAERGHADHGWLKAAHTFSFAGYHDPAHMSFRSLRVMNEDRVAPGRGFGTHPHRDMEIVTYVLSGALEHIDSMGNGEVLRPGEFQRITAGTGITHSEFNPSKEEETHLYQIWLLPAEDGLTPGYEQKTFDQSQRHNRLQLVASPTGEEGSLTIHQDVRIFLADPQAGTTLTVDTAADRHLWIQVLDGQLETAGHAVATGDGVAVSAEQTVSLTAAADSRLLIFDLA